MAIAADISELEDLYRFVAVLTWHKENPDPNDKVHQDKKSKEKLVELLTVQPHEVQQTFTFNLCGERTFLITGYIASLEDLDTFIEAITHDGSGNLTNISVEFAPQKDLTEVVSVGVPFQVVPSPEPDGYYRFVAKLSWDKKDDQDARKRITDILTRVQN